MKIALALLFLLALAGCAPMMWDKAGGTQAAYNIDQYACEKDARQSGYYGGGIPGGLEMREFYKRCMVSKGYMLRAENPAPPAPQVTVIPPPPSGAPPPPPRNVAPVATQPQQTNAIVPGPMSLRVDHLIPGVSTMAQAIQLLGKPIAESTLANKSKLLQWIESSGGSRSQVAVLFDEAGTMVRITYRFNYN